MLQRAHPSNLAWNGYWRLPTHKSEQIIKEPLKTFRSRGFHSSFFKAPGLHQGCSGFSPQPLSCVRKLSPRTAHAVSAWCRQGVGVAGAAIRGVIQENQERNKRTKNFEEWIGVSALIWLESLRVEYPPANHGLTARLRSSQKQLGLVYCGLINEESAGTTPNSRIIFVRRSSTALFFSFQTFGSGGRGMIRKP